MFYTLNVANSWEHNNYFTNYSILLKDKYGNVIDTDVGTMEDVSAQVADYYSIMFGLQYCLDKGIDKVLVFAESRQLVCRLTGFSTVEYGLTKLLYNKTMSLIGEFENVIFESVHKINNNQVRELMNQPLFD